MHKICRELLIKLDHNNATDELAWNVYIRIKTPKIFIFKTYQHLKNSLLKNINTQFTYGLDTAYGLILFGR